MKNVISIASANPDTQTGFAATQIAKFIARNNRDKKILMVSLDFAPGNDEITFENISPFESFPVQTNRSVKNLHTIYMGRFLGSNDITPDIAEYLIKKLANKYDAIICDCKGELENALALGCLFRSDNTYYVFDHTMASIKRFAWIKPILDKLAIHVAGEIFDVTTGNLEYEAQDIKQYVWDEQLRKTTLIEDHVRLVELFLLARDIVKDIWGKDILPPEMEER